MAYCPKCGREQRCGCEKCHICGGELVERRASQRGEPGRAVAHAGGEPRREPLSTGPRKPESPSHERREGVRRPRANGEKRSVLHTLLLVLGGGILVIALLEAIHTGLNFPGVGTTLSIGEGLKRTGYYLGNLLYTSSVRILTGFALVSAGLLLKPEKHEADRQAARRSRLAVGFTMGGIAFLCGLASLLLVIPSGTSSLILKNLLPSLWAAVCILMVMGAALLFGGYLLVFGIDSGEPPGPASRRRWRPHTRNVKDRVHGGLVRTVGGADRDYGGTVEDAEESPGGTRRGVVKSFMNGVSSSEGDAD